MSEQEIQLIKELKFCVFDLETTGGNHKSDKIIEIGLVQVDALEITKTKHFLINPQIKIPEFIQKLTSISQDDVADAPLIEDVMDELVEFMGDRILVAHNISFDVPFFNSVLRRLNRPEMENKGLCTNLMTRYLIPNLLNSNLNYMSKIFDIEHNKAHRALDDALASARLMLKYLDIYIDKGIKKVNHLYYPRNKYELDRLQIKRGDDLVEATKKIKDVKTPFLATIKGENGVILFSFPTQANEEEIKYVLDAMDSNQWESVTIRLFGSFIETFIQFNNLYNKLEIKTKKEVLKKLKDFHASKLHDKAISEDTKNARKVGDFVLTKHLVPEQYVIFPMKSLHPKSGLIFRYPGHKKKLLQYVQSRSSKNASSKIKKIHFSPQIKEFINLYLRHEFEHNEEVMIFKKDLALNNADHFYAALDKFSSKNDYHYNYPKDYI
jgi:DNA polymerase-3 subunit epsilon